MKRRRNTEKRETVSARRFIEVWQSSSSLAEVATKVQRNKNACRVRAFRYRKRGVALKYFVPEEIEFPDWEELGELAARLAPPVPELAGTTWVGIEDDSKLLFDFRSDGTVAGEGFFSDGNFKGTWTVTCNVLHIKFEYKGGGWIKYRGTIDGDTIRGKGEGKNTWNFSVAKVG